MFPLGSLFVCRPLKYSPPTLSQIVYSLAFHYSFTTYAVSTNKIFFSFACFWTLYWWNHTSFILCLLHSLSIIFLRFIYADACNCTSFIFTAVLYSIICLHCNWFTPLVKNIWAVGDFFLLRKCCFEHYLWGNASLFSSCSHLHSPMLIITNTG